MTFLVSDFFEKCFARIPGAGGELRVVYRPVSLKLLEELEVCQTVNDLLAALVTHVLDDDELIVIDPRILQKASPRRAREIVEGIFKARESGVVYYKQTKEAKQMEISQLENFFKEKTEITLATVGEDGAITEETVKIYHHAPFDQTGESAAKNTNIMGLLLEEERDKENPIPVVTRQLHILGVWSKDFTLGGAPFVLTPAIESIKIIPLQVQRKIANEICAPALAQLRAFTDSAQDEARSENGASDVKGKDTEDSQSLQGNSAEDRSGSEEAQPSES